jgi:hypothetical protein
MAWRRFYSWLAAPHASLYKRKTTKMIFMPGDHVSYTGEKLKELRKARDLFVVAPVQGSTMGLVVESGGDAFIVSRDNLTQYRPSPKEEKEEKGPVVEKRRTKKYSKNDEE